MEAIINFREKTYEESYKSLLRDIEEVAAMAVRAVNFNGSGGFPAREPEGGERIKEESKK